MIRHAEKAGAALLALACAALTIHPEHESDIFWHMLLGRSVLEHLSRVVPEPIAFPAFSDPCVVPEWLWGAAAWLLYAAGGWLALHAALAATAGLAALALWALAGETAPGLHPAARLLVPAAAMAAALGRMRLRPESFAVLALPLFLLLAVRYARAGGRRRVILGGALLLLSLVWAQAHGSFVLGPPLFLAAVAGGLLRPATPRRRLLDLALLALLAATLLSSAYGADIGAYILVHAAGYARAHVADMRGVSWEVFDPAVNPFGALYLALWVTALLGMARARSLFAPLLAPALLGLALSLSAVRFSPTGTILLAPLLARSLHELLPTAGRRALATGVAAAAALALLVLSARTIHERRGPIGRIGLPGGRHPTGAAAWLAAHGERGNVLTQYRDGPPLAFLLGGKARTYVDGRTPLYFGDADLAVANAVWEKKAALDGAVRRFGVTAIVAQRGSALCRNVGEGWVPVMVEPGHTAFARAGSVTGLALLAPCGPALLADGACADGGAALSREIAAIGAYADAPFVRLLRAEKALACGAPAASAEALVPPAREVWAYRQLRDRLLVRIWIGQGKLAQAVDTALALIELGDTSVIGFFAGRLADPKLEKRLLGRFFALYDDETPGAVSLALARACALTGDAPCAALHGLRAAALGEPGAAGILRWLEKNHPSARVRADARAWLTTIKSIP